MADERMINIDRLPTLTEVLEVGRELPPARWHDAPRPSAVVAMPLAEPPTLLDAVPVFDEALIVQRVLALLQPRIDSLLAERINDALAPVLARAADTLIREAREPLMAALAELATESLSQVLRQEDRSNGRSNVRSHGSH